MCFFFFFKQKTAYEMRISDWSSDVCSSDLVAEGALVRLGNRRGNVKLHAKLFGGVQRGVVIVESVWPNSAFEEGIGINALTGADPAKPNGGAAFHDRSEESRVGKECVSTCRSGWGTVH